jgi:polysaccharide export outer membrane protein
MTQLLLGVLLAGSLSGPVAGAAASAQQEPQRPQVPRATDARSNYTVGVSDVLKIMVFNEEALTGSFRIDDDGSISYPMLGRIHVAGKSVREIEEQIRTALLDGWVRRPEVAVEVEQFRSRTLFIMGEVRTPGKYPLQGDMTLLEVLALAGSVTTEASSDVRILRPRDKTEGPAKPDDSVEVVRVNLDDMNSGKMSANIVLQDGDTVYVPTAERFYVSGHVRTPGSFKFVRGMNVQQAIAVAGGLTDRGSSRGIKIRRLVGTEQKLIDATLTDLVEAGDTIIIRQRFI